MISTRAEGVVRLCSNELARGREPHVEVRASGDHQGARTVVCR
jgi:hypothetical protein